MNASYDHKIGLLVAFFESPVAEFRLGSLIFLFELIYNFRESLTEEAISLILKEVYDKIPGCYESRDFY